MSWLLVSFLTYSRIIKGNFEIVCYDDEIAGKVFKANIHTGCGVLLFHQRNLPTNAWKTHII